MESLELGNTGFDHTAISVEINWSDHVSLPATRLAAQHLTFDRNKIAQAELHASLLHHPVPAWTCSVDQHYTAVNEHVLKCLEHHCPIRRSKIKKPYIDEEAWQLRKVKIHCRKSLKAVHRLQRRETLARIFHSWRRPVFRLSTACQ